MTGPASPAPWRYQPMVPVAGAVIAGILAADAAGGGPSVWAALAAAAGGAWLVLHVRRGRGGDRFGAGTALVLAMLAAVAAARYADATRPGPRDVARLAAAGPRIVTLEGIVIRSPRRYPPPADVFLPTLPYYERTSVRLRAERADVGGRAVPLTGTVSLTVRGPMPADAGGGPPVRLGDRVRVVGIVRGFLPPANPGAFDVGRYLARQGVGASMRTDHWEAVRVTRRGAEPVLAAVGAVRRWGLARLDRIPSAEGRAVVSAVMFGRRDLVALGDEDGDAQATPIQEAFLASGTGHYLAVSGLHVGLVAGVVLALARLLGLGRRPTAVAVAAVVLVYALMTELKPSVLRAAILVWVLCAGWMTARQPLRLNSLATAAVIVLLVRPADLFSLGFQMSFGVVLALVWLVPKLETSVFRADPEAERLMDAAGGRGYVLLRWARRTAAITLAASLVSVPLIAHTTHLVAWLAPVASVLLAPLVFVMLAGGMALVAVGWVSGHVADVVAAVPDGAARAVAGVVRGLAAVPGGHFHVADFGAAWLVVLYALLAAWVARERLGVPKRRLTVAALVAAAGFVWTTGHRPPRHVRATVVAVGSGLATLLETPSGHTLLYDCGSPTAHAGAAEAAIAPALWARGVERLDAAVISHPHFDHFKDLLPIADRFGLRRVYVPPTFLRRGLSVDDAVVAALRERGIEVTFMGSGDRLAGAGDTALRCVWPRGRASRTECINDGSLVLDVADAGGTRLLLTGDIEPPAMRGLVRAAPDLRADVFLWPHHGAAPEATADLAAALEAELAIISSGRRASGTAATAWLEERGVRCLNTADVGAVTVTLAPDGPRARTVIPPSR